MPTLEQLTNFARERRSTIDQAIGRRRALEEQYGTAVAERDRLQEDVETYGKVLALFQAMTQSIQETFLKRIQELVTMGLQSVFGQMISFEIDTKVKGNSVTLDFRLLDEEFGTESTDLFNARGGGVICLVGVIMRIIMVRLLAKQLRPVLFLDEPFAMLSEEYLEPAGIMLRSLATELGIQIVLITHQPEFIEYADKAYRLSKSDNGVEVTEVEKGLQGVA